MKLYLSSDGLGNKKYILEEWKKENDNKILVVPNAKDYLSEKERREKIEEKTRDLIEMGFEIEVLDLKKYFSGKNLEDDIKNYHCFYIIGGNVFILRKAMQLSKFDVYLKEISKKDRYLYIGFSAGSCVLSPTLKYIDILDEPINIYNDDNVIYDGLNLINYIFVPQHKSNKGINHKVEKMIKKLDENNMKYKVLSESDTIIEDI